MSDFLTDIAEDARAANAAVLLGAFGPDNRYWQDLGYAFQLHIGATKILFPLVLAPTRYEKTLTFAVELTAAQEGGIAAEEQGIVLGPVTIAGHTGVRPRTGGGSSIPLSGQAHFIRLQNELFDRYSELKKDPTVSASVFMTWHAFGENDHLIVVPRSFKAPRDSSRRVHYAYEIQLESVGKAEALVQKAAEDNPVLSAIKNVAAQLASAVAAIEGGITRFTNLHPEIGQAFQVVQGTVDAVTAAITLEQDVMGGIQRVAGVVNEFARGLTRFIELPYQTLIDTRDSLDTLVSALVRAENIPNEVIQTYRQAGDALDAIGAYPEKFSEGWATSAQAFLDLTKGPASASTDTLNAAAPATRTQQLTSTGVQAGDNTIVAGVISARAKSFPRYQGFREYEVRFGDTLAVIASRELGDARRWVDLAIANRLKAPFISAEAIPGTLAPGDRLLIPTLTATTPPDTVHSGGDPAFGASQYEAMLGIDWKLVKDADGRFDLVVDVAGGSTDFTTVKGVENVEQAILVILATTQGSNPLYRFLGVVALVGNKGTLNRLIEAQLNVTQALLRDPRIEGVRSIHFILVDDAAAADISVDLISKIQTRTIARTRT